MKIFSLNIIGHLFPLFRQFPRAGNALFVFHKGSSNYVWVTEGPKQTFVENWQFLEKYTPFHIFLLLPRR